MPFKNPEDLKAWGKRYYSTHKEESRARGKRWVNNNPDKHREICDRWKDNNANHVREMGRKYASDYRARKRNAFVESVDHLTVFERDGGICQICHEPIGKEKWHVDHVAPLVAGGEHSYANVQLSHASCNLRKWAKVQ